MNRKQTKKKIVEMLDKRYLFEDDFNFIYDELEKLSHHKGEEEFYNKHMGKLLLKTEKDKEAKKFFKKLLMVGKDSETAYYNLYKISLNEQKYELALMNLYKYKENSNENSLPIDLQISMIESYLKNEYKNEIDFKTEIPIIKNIDDEEILNLYKRLINNYNCSNYNEMINTLTNIEKIAENKNISIDTKPIYKIIKELTTQKDRVLKNSNRSVNHLYKIIDNIMILETPLAEKLINKLENPKTEEAKVFKKYLTSKLEERKKYLALSDEKKEIYADCVARGHKAMHKKLYDIALDYYEDGLKETNHPVFYYYIGKTYYKQHENKKSYEYLSKYEETSGDKFSKSNLFLFLLEKKEEKYEQAEIRREKTNIVNKILNNRQLQELKAIEEESVKKKEEELKIEKYYEYKIVDKLRIIKNLYENKNIKLADKLMKELEQEENKTKLEKKMIQTEKANKKVYVRRSKFNQ